MTAQKARELAEKTSLEGIDEVYNSIEQAAQKGEYKAYYYAHFKYAVISKLRDDGFHVMDATDKDGACYIISWDAPKKSFSERVAERLEKTA